MSAVPVARYLIEFGPDGNIGKERSQAPLARSMAEDSAERIEQAYSRGFEHGKSAAEAAFNAELERRTGLFEQQLLSERHAWATEAGERLSEQLVSGLQGVEAKIAKTVARILEPFLVAELHRQAVAELLEILQALVSKDPAVTMDISGPEDLLQVLRERLAGQTAAVTFSPSDECDVRVLAGQTILETRLGAWVAKIEEAIG